MIYHFITRFTITSKNKKSHSYDPAHLTPIIAIAKRIPHRSSFTVYSYFKLSEFLSLLIQQLTSQREYLLHSQQLHLTVFVRGRLTLGDLRINSKVTMQTQLYPKASNCIPSREPNNRMVRMICCYLRYNRRLIKYRYF